MISRKSTFFLGIFLFLIPFFGLPTTWKTFLIVCSAIILVALSVQIDLPTKVIKKNSKPAVRRRVLKGKNIIISQGTDDVSFSPISGNSGGLSSSDPELENQS